MTQELHMKILATYKVIQSERYDCTRCVKRFDERQRKGLGCFGGEQVVAVLGTREGYKLTKCPGNFYDETCAYFYELFHLFKEGNLPFPGTVSEQPAQTMEVFSVISELEKAKQERQTKKNGG